MNGMWGTSWRQRLRLAPLYCAMLAADACARFVPARHVGPHAPWGAGLSVIIPERAAPAMLEDALAAVATALKTVGEASEVIVVVNGAPLSDYAEVRQRYPRVEFLHADAPLGFAGAVALGLDHARHHAVYLLNNDMVVAADALTAVLALRAPDVFAIGSQIEQRSADGRREETGFVDWYIDRDGIRLFHANVPADGQPREHLAASGGAALFRRDPLRRYLEASRAYDPFYWEDAEWGVQAWRDGWRVLYCPASRARHRHRATTSRFYTAAELARVVERNRWLFEARNGLVPHGAAWQMERACQLPYASQRELAPWRVAAATWRQRRHRWRAPQPLPPSMLAHPEGSPTTLHNAAYSFRLRAVTPSTRPVVLVVTPFAAYPPRHGGARRVAALIAGLREAFDVVLVTDEAFLHDARSFAHFDGLRAVILVQRISTSVPPDAPTLAARMHEHTHAALTEAVAIAIARHAPAIVQVEHAELAWLVQQRTAEQRWVLDLHDAYAAAEFGTEGAPLPAFDAITVVSSEDSALIEHGQVVRVANGSDLDAGPWVASTGAQLLFVGPFRYGPNRDGIARFIAEAWPAILAAEPATTILILAGDEHAHHGEARAAAAQPGVRVLGHRDDMATLLAQCTLTINPLSGIRGSAVKIAESLVAGRVCVSTVEGARG
ncbi:MAG: glycosyltransferase, partial [Casimicrobiaceae bacterium]